MARSEGGKTYENQRRRGSFSNTVAEHGARVRLKLLVRHSYTDELYDITGTTGGRRSSLASVRHFRLKWFSFFSVLFRAPWGSRDGRKLHWLRGGFLPLQCCIESNEAESFVNGTLRRTYCTTLRVYAVCCISFEGCFFFFVFVFMRVEGEKTVRTRVRCKYSFYVPSVNFLRPTTTTTTVILREGGTEQENNSA